MDAITRLVSTGMRLDCAIDLVAWFRREQNDAGLEKYIQKAEAEHRERICAVQP